MLGQHVYIERDVGQEEQKTGLWLSEDFIAGIESGDPFVWGVDENSKLIKKSVKLGEYDMYELKYEILDGITEDDYIAFPAASLEEGMTARPGTLDQTITWEIENMENIEDGADSEDGEFEDSEYYTDDFNVDVEEVYDDTAGGGAEMIEGEDVYVIDDAEFSDDSEMEIIDDAEVEVINDPGMEIFENSANEFVDEPGMEIDPGTEVDSGTEMIDNSEVEVINDPNF